MIRAAITALCLAQPAAAQITAQDVLDHQQAAYAALGATPGADPTGDLLQAPTLTIPIPAR